MFIGFGQDRRMVRVPASFVEESDFFTVSEFGLFMVHLTPLQTYAANFYDHKSYTGTLSRILNDVECKFIEIVYGRVYIHPKNMDDIIVVQTVDNRLVFVYDGSIVCVTNSVYASLGFDGIEVLDLLDELAYTKAPSRVNFCDMQVDTRIFNLITSMHSVQNSTSTTFFIKARTLFRVPVTVATFNELVAVVNMYRDLPLVTMVDSSFAIELNSNFTTRFDPFFDDEISICCKYGSEMHITKPKGSSVDDMTAFWTRHMQDSLVAHRKLIADSLSNLPIHVVALEIARFII